jgi:hypothetical protein
VAILVFADQQTADRVVAEIEVTAPIDGGAGAVRFGRLVPLADGRFLAAHPFQVVDLDWIAIYADEPGLEILP